MRWVLMCGLLCVTSQSFGYSSTQGWYDALYSADRGAADVMLNALEHLSHEAEQEVPDCQRWTEQWVLWTAKPHYSLPSFQEVVRDEILAMSYSQRRAFERSLAPHLEAMLQLEAHCGGPKSLVEALHRSEHERGLEQVRVTSH